MMVQIKVLLAIAICIFALTNGCNSKPLDIYDEIIDNDEEQLLLRMAELIDSIGSDNQSSLSSSSSTAASAINDLKDMKPGERCILPVFVKGMCRALISRWSYDPSTKSCKEFKFGGCDGNGNNFPTKKQCLEVCKGI
ncbi:tissue factor pathway inhibitor [Contarinia nasturtii]|uniref:tissue factor pathway inhibitor n=1 Tax=Contarinia nasturtii TaxID=265458 RepID=UPI0012D41B25|nr:tissue factor pathway inhibitor [Contarinia nasturtii]